MKDLKGITQDSRQVENGYLFAALPGTKTDGGKFIADAIAQGATHILTLPGTDIPPNDNVTIITVDNPRQKFAELVAEFYEGQPKTIIAITGTNGKTSTAIFAQQLWEMAGTKAVSMGTIGIHGSGIDLECSMTTLDPVSLHKNLVELAEQGITHLAIEASSEGLDQCRLSGLRVKAAGFTNLSRDHLDYHLDMEPYLAAKIRLFTDILEEGGTAVLNADIPEFSDLKNKCVKEIKCGKVISYGFAGEDLKIMKITPTAYGQDIDLQINGENYEIHFPLVGEFQVMNALCALGLVTEGENLADHVKHLKDLKGVPGRLQPVSGHPESAGVYIDYAHTPDALQNILTALRLHTENRLICITGCGGERDKGKRPQMAKIASDLADHVIITDDNPRSEDPAQIRKDMIVGIEKDNFEEIDGRSAAINKAVQILQKGDVLVIAGKGHEQGIQFSDHTEPFDDVREAEKSIQQLLNAK